MNNVTIVKDEWSVAFNHYRSRWSNYVTPFTQVRQIVEQSVDNAYKSAGASTPDAWPPRRSLYSHPPLIETGRMRSGQLAAVRSAPYYSTPNGHVLDFRHVAFATPITKFHHFGTIHMPARRAFNLRQDEQEKIIEILGHHTLRLP